MKNLDEISDLIIRFLTGKADAPEIEKLERWYDASQGNRELFRQLCRDLEQGRHYVHVDTAHAFEIVRRRTGRHSGVLRHRIVMAASIALLAITAASFYLLRPAVVSEQPLTDWQEVAAKVVLTLPDGSHRNLDARTPATDSLGMRRDSTGVLRVEALAARPTEYYEISVGTGPEQTIELSDGTRVWLSDNSYLRFPLRFDGNQRCVEASGEVYFDVAHIPGQPFIVSTNGSSVSVFGTEFLIQNSEDHTLATLIEGSVAFSAPDGSSVRLSPGNQAETTGTDITLRDVDTRLYTALRDGYLVFDRMTLAQIAEKLESRYECRIRLTDPSVANQFISARIRRYPTLRPILDMLARVGHFTYTEHEGDIVIE